MKKIIKYMIFTLLVGVVFSVGINVYAEDKCATYGSSCVKKTYQFDKNGNIKPFSITLGVVHFKDIDKKNNNEQFIQFYDNYCDKCSEGQSCMNYCSDDSRRFDIADGLNISMDVDFDTVMAPIAVCAFPRVNSQFLNDSITDSNVSNYLYYTDSQINNAVSNGYCEQSDIYYTQGKICKNKTKVTSFMSNVELKYNDFNVNSTSAGVSICTIRFSKDGFSKTITNTGSSVLCIPENYDVSCQKIPGEGYECSLYTCDNNKTTAEGVGMKCELKSIDDSSNSIQLNYTYNKDGFGVKVDAILENGNAKPIDGSSINIGDETYAEFNTCPAYVYKIVLETSDGKTSIGYEIFSTEAERQTYDKNNKYLSNIAVKYKFNSSSDVGILTEDELFEDIEAGSDNDKKEEDSGYDNSIFDTDKYGCPKALRPIIYFIKKLVFNTLQIFVPIILILMGTIDFVKASISVDDKVSKEVISKFIKRVLAAVLMFFIVTIVSIVMNMFASTDVGKQDGWQACWNNID